MYAVCDARDQGEPARLSVVRFDRLDQVEAAMSAYWFVWNDGEMSRLEIPADYLDREMVRLDRPRQPTLELRGSLVIQDRRTVERGEFVPRDWSTGHRTYHQRRLP